MNDNPQPQGNWLTRMLSPTPTSTAGMMQNQDLYNMHVQQALAKGSQPLSRAQFLQALQTNPKIASDIQRAGMPSDY
jgi:hypothetical protein